MNSVLMLMNRCMKHCFVISLNAGETNVFKTCKLNCVFLFSGKCMLLNIH